MSSNGQKVTASVIVSGAVAGTAVVAGALTGNVTTLALPALTAFFGFLGGLVMGKVLA